MNTNKLKALLAEFGHTQADFAKILNCSEPTANRKINGKDKFTYLDLVRIREAYQLTSARFDAIFFESIVS